MRQRVLRGACALLFLIVSRSFAEAPEGAAGRLFQVYRVHDVPAFDASRRPPKLTAKQQPVAAADLLGSDSAELLAVDLHAMTVSVFGFGRPDPRAVFNLPAGSASVAVGELSGSAGEELAVLSPARAAVEVFGLAGEEKTLLSTITHPRFAAVDSITAVDTSGDGLAEVVLYQGPRIVGVLYFSFDAEPKTFWIEQDQLCPASTPPSDCAAIGTGPDLVIATIDASRYAYRLKVAGPLTYIAPAGDDSRADLPRRALRLNRGIQPSYLVPAPTDAYVRAVFPNQSQVLMNWASVPAHARIREIVTGDFDGNGFSDIAAQQQVGSFWMIALSNGTTAIEHALDPGLPAGALRFVAAADADGDRLDDLIVVTNEGDVWTALSRTAEPAPDVSVLLPSLATVSTDNQGFVTLPEEVQGPLTLTMEVASSPSDSPWSQQGTIINEISPDELAYARRTALAEKAW